MYIMTENAGKLLCINNGKCLYIYKVFLELSLGSSLLLYMRTPLELNSLLNEISNLFYMRRLNRVLPSRIYLL